MWHPMGHQCDELPTSMLGLEERLDGDSVVGFSIAVDDDGQVIMIGVDCEDTSSQSRVGSLS